MSDLIQFTDAKRQGRALLHSGWLSGGTLKLYTAPVPATADTALTTQTLLVTFVLHDPIGEVESGVITGAAIDAAMVAAEGTVAFGRAYDSLGNTIGDYSVGGALSSEAIRLDNLNLVQGAYATILSFVIVEG